MSKLVGFLNIVSKVLLIAVLVLFPLVRGIGYVMARELWEHHRNFLGISGYRQLYDYTQVIGLPNVAPALLEAVHLTGWFFVAIAVVNGLALFRLFRQDDGGSWLTLLVFTPFWSYGVYHTARTIDGPWQLAVAIVVITYVCLGIELKRIWYRFEFPF